MQAAWVVEDTDAWRPVCAPVIAVASVITIGSFPFLAIADSWLAMAVTIVIFGASLGTVDVAMNIQAVMVERDSGKPMMSGFHGLFSLGGIVGAGGMSGLIALAGLPPLVAAIMVSIASLVLVMGSAQAVAPSASDCCGGGICCFAQSSCCLH